MDTSLFIKIAFLLLFFDFLWINFIFYNPFASMIQDIQGGTPLRAKPLGAIIAYLILIIFAYKFLPKTTSNEEAFMLGFLLYAVYDSTNYATLDKYQANVAIIDALWGGVLFTLIKIFI